VSCADEDHRVDHYVLVAPDVEALIAWYRDELGLQPERLEEWRRGEVLFASLRVSDSTLIDVFTGERSGVNVDHVALTVEGVDLDELAPPAGSKSSGSRDSSVRAGTGRGLYIRDPAGNRVELRTY